MVGHDPAIDHAGRFARFLDRAISDFKPKGTTPMPEPQPLIPPNSLKTGDELVASLTGAGSLATALTGRIAAAKAKFAAANSKVDAAFGNLDKASQAFDVVARKIDAEAEAALSQLRQVSNLAPD